MYKLIMADGQELRVLYCGAWEGHLTIQVYDLSVVEAATLFTDTEKTGHMVYDYHAGQTVFDGYTDFVSMHTAEDLTIVVLSREK